MSTNTAHTELHEQGIGYACDNSISLAGQALARLGFEAEQASLELRSSLGGPRFDDPMHPTLQPFGLRAPPPSIDESFSVLQAPAFPGGRGLIST